MEFGPRALGARSILADARSDSIQSLLNLKIKYRESFRPFGPAVLEERAADYFDLEGSSPYMLVVGSVRKRFASPLRMRQAGSRPDQRAPLDDSGGNARRLFGAHPDSGRRIGAALPGAA